MQCCRSYISTQSSIEAYAPQLLMPHVKVCFNSALTNSTRIFPISLLGEVRPHALCDHAYGILQLRQVFVSFPVTPSWGVCCSLHAPHSVHPSLDIWQIISGNACNVLHIFLWCPGDILHITYRRTVHHASPHADLAMSSLSPPPHGLVSVKHLTCKMCEMQAMQPSSSRGEV